MAGTAAAAAGQPIFYPVLNQEYATMTARDWNVKRSGAGYVTRFRVRRSFLDHYEVHQVGGHTPAPSDVATCALRINPGVTLTQGCSPWRLRPALAHSGYLSRTVAAGPTCSTQVTDMDEFGVSWALPGRRAERIVLHKWLLVARSPGERRRWRAGPGPAAGAAGPAAWSWSARVRCSCRGRTRPRRVMAAGVRISPRD